MEDLYLVHHGIKGQKWGVRRYQNDDGSYTDAGKRRYLKDMKKDMNEHFHNQISKEASKVTTIGRNGYDNRGSAWNKAYIKGKVTSKDDAQIKKAATETRKYMKEKYGEDAVKALATKNIKSFTPKTIESGKGFVSDHKLDSIDFLRKHGAIIDGYEEHKLPPTVLQEIPNYDKSKLYNRLKNQAMS